MVYNTGISLGFFEHPSVIAFLQRLQPAYKPPTRRQLDNTLLDNAYNTTKERVEDYIDT